MITSVHRQYLVHTSVHIAEKTKAKIRFSNKSSDEFLQHSNEKSFYLKPTSLDEFNFILK